MGARLYQLLPKITECCFVGQITEYILIKKCKFYEQQSKAWTKTKHFHWRHEHISFTSKTEVSYKSHAEYCRGDEFKLQYPCWMQGWSGGWPLLCQNSTSDFPFGPSFPYLSYRRQHPHLSSHSSFERTGDDLCEDEIPSEKPQIKCSTGTPCFNWLLRRDSSSTFLHDSVNNILTWPAFGILCMATSQTSDEFFSYCFAFTHGFAERRTVPCFAASFRLHYPRHRRSFTDCLCSPMAPVHRSASYFSPWRNCYCTHKFNNRYFIYWLNSLLPCNSLHWNSQTRNTTGIATSYSRGKAAVWER